MIDLVPGQIVRSTAGRDKGVFMVVVELLDGDHAAVCDGRLRKISSPKKKKTKHLARTNRIDNTIQEKLLSGSKVSNAEIRRVLDKYNTEEPVKEI